MKPGTYPGASFSLKSRGPTKLPVRDEVSVGTSVSWYSFTSFGREGKSCGTGLDGWIFGVHAETKANEDTRRG